MLFCYKKYVYLCGVKNRRLILTLVLVVSVLQLVAQPSGINHTANRIVLNGDDWSEMIELLEKRSGKFTIVHIGDSHVQPGIISNEVRHALQSQYGNGGRGLVCPLRLAGTNEPNDYVMTSSVSISASSRLLSKSKPAGMGMTGVAVKFAGGSTTFNLRTKTPGDDFYRITIFHSPEEWFDVSQNGMLLKAHNVSQTATNYVLNSFADSATLCLKGTGAIYGVRLLNSTHGVVLDCIGNNGATYGSYLGVNGFARQIKDLNPQLVIVSLGTNEAYGSLASVGNNIDRLVASISQECPDAKFLLTTPIETHKKGGRGYVIQTGVATVRDIILNYCKTHKIAVWDFYTVAGGRGAANRWLATKYMKTDHLHLTDQGYRFMGGLFAEALLNLFTGKHDGSSEPVVDSESQDIEKRDSVESPEEEKTPEPSQLTTGD